MRHSLVFSSFGAEFTEWSCSCGANGSSVESCYDHLGKIEQDSIREEQRALTEVRRAFAAILEAQGWTVSPDIPSDKYPLEVIQQDLRYVRYGEKGVCNKYVISVFAYRLLKKESIPHEQV